MDYTGSGWAIDRPNDCEGKNEVTETCLWHNDDGCPNPEARFDFYATIRIRQCEIMPSAFLRVVRSTPVAKLLQSAHKMSHILHSYSWHLTMRTVMFVFVFTTALYALIPIYAECAEFFFCSGLQLVHRLYHCHCFGVGLIFFAHTHRHHCHVGDTLLDIWTRRDTFACLHENRWTCTQWMNVWMKCVCVPCPCVRLSTFRLTEI